MSKGITRGEAQQIKCRGSGIRCGFLGNENKFTILTSEKHEIKNLKVGIEGPCKAELKLTTNKNKTVDAVYTVTTAGTYKIHIQYGEHNVAGSPHTCKIYGDVQAQVDKTKISGATARARSGRKNEITIDGKEAGVMGNLSVHLEGPGEVNLEVNDKDDGLTHCTYSPTVAGEYNLQIKFQGYHLPGSPFTVVCK